ncbi:DUF3122 domain-containing protein [Kamptonema sp. UHCC 0994]|uniref:DUF3122 domain-containing protein n=1 Tax=Kamptonema sp. UHCC 0994 TaxID=3031329 RepID=UPI0023B8CE8A|nr:DUF3122 domain-containing protein [Kamptonema sp. UHCC 0994]MDF0554391.1 DUF3122 domain-containing protein [Kamptonema sp. UHCC 0994]
MLKKSQEPIQKLHQFIALVFMLLMLAWALNLGLVIFPAHAAGIRQLEESPGQMVYQSRQTLKDRHGNSWQAIAFKRIRPDGTANIYLRLVSFPGIAEFDRTRSLILTNSLNKTWTATDVSQQIFTDAAHLEPNVGQYELGSILTQLEPTVPLLLKLPTLNSTEIHLNVSPALIKEWRSLLL